MEPTLSSGDVILIDRSADHIDDNAVYLLRLNGTLLVKRIKRNMDGSVW
ncbi:MAG: S24 family peptidase [Oryzomonas sp.]|nr:S24 family peptidase [Oryzomonas sp.]MDR3580695.1 S24 family peptidase [Oryzomonas sp.]